MKNKYTRIVIFLVTGLFCLMVNQQSYAETNNRPEKWRYHLQTQVKWRNYNAEAFSEAKKTNKPLYIFVYSDLCSWCRKFETESLEKPAIRKILGSEFIPVLVDQVTQPELAKQLGITLVPASLLITPDKKKLLRFYGFVSEIALTDALNRTLISWKKGEIPEEEFGDERTCCPVPNVR